MSKRLQKYKDLIIKDYSEGMQVIPLSKKYKIDRKNISLFLRTYYKVKRLPIRIKSNNYFEVIDSYNKAYVLGFIAADGAVVKASKYNNYQLTITIKYEDKQLLEFIKNEINPTSNLTEIKRKCSFNPNKQIHHIRFTYGNQKLIKDLFSLGIYPKKSLSMNNIIENIPKKYRKAFIIGYLDGDGSVILPKGKSKYIKKLHKYKKMNSYSIHVSFRGTIPFLEGIVKELNLNAIPRFYSSIGSLVICQKQDVVKIFNCYEGLSFYLSRKYNKFLERINHSSYDIYK